jgi:hypothetical protein
VRESVALVGKAELDFGIERPHTGGCEVGVNLLACRLPYTIFGPGSRGEVKGSA